MKGKKWIGNKYLKEFQEEIKKCVIVDIEDFKVVLEYNGLNKIILNFKISFYNMVRIGK
jgi:hypothetical protein